MTAGKVEHLGLITRFYDEMWNRFDTSVFAEILDPGIAFRGSLGQVKVGFDQLADYVDVIQAFSSAFHNEVMLTITEGDHTFARLSYTGTHDGEIFGIPATGRRFEYAGAAVFTIREGLIREVWILGDIHGLIQQLRARRRTIWAFRRAGDTARCVLGRSAHRVTVRLGPASL